MRPKISNLSRREFLYYMWAGSLGTFAVQGGALSIWYGLASVTEPNEYKIDAVDFTTNEWRFFETAPVLVYRTQPFWLVNLPDGIISFLTTCTARGCSYKWVLANSRFECPCSGSKYEINGTMIEGPAPRHLDRYALEISTSDGVFGNYETGDPIPVKLETIKQITVNFDRVIRGKPVVI